MGSGTYKPHEQMKAMQLKPAWRRPRRALPKLTTELEAAAYARKYFKSAGVLNFQEMFIVVPTNVSLEALGVIEVSKGGKTQTIVDVRVVFSQLLLANATQFLCFHNHPSGSTKPSDADIKMTKQLIEAGKILQIHLVDHVIVTQESSCSIVNHLNN
jgi:DNA repair protein RadC